MNASAVFAAVIFSAIGLGIFIYGKRSAEWRPMLLGVALMGYSYVVPGAVLPWVIGVLLTAAFWFCR